VAHGLESPFPPGKREAVGQKAVLTAAGLVCAGDERERDVQTSRSEVAKTVLGLDIGGSKIGIVEGTADGQILQRRGIPSNSHVPFDEGFPNIAALVDELRQESRKAGREVKALSISVGGPLRIREGVLLDPPHLPGWHNVKLKERLAQTFPDLPVCVEHDGNAGALAEFRFGIGRQRPDLQHLVFLTFGTGLGAGLIVNGQIVHGVTDTAGEIGHWRLSNDGPIGYGKKGSWEAFSSGDGLVLLAAQRFPSRWSAKTAVRDLVELMLAGDEDALAVATEAGTWMGRGLALLVDAFNPQVIVLGSLAVVLGERVLAPMRRVVVAEALPQAAAACEIVPSVLGPQIGDVAALMAALNDPSVRKILETDQA
jgi:glucokinase